MKNKLNVLLAFTVLAILFSCNKGGVNDNCSECDGGEITICDLGNGKAVAKGNGKEVEVTYNDGSDWDVVVAAACKEFSALSSNCYECTANAESTEICEKEGNIFIDGDDQGPLKEGVSLEDFIKILESNPENDPRLEGVECKKK